MRLVDSDGFLFLENDRVVGDVVFRKPVGTGLGFLPVSFDRRDQVLVELRSSDDHVHSLAIVIVSLIVLSPSALFTRLIFRRTVLGSGLISLRRAIGIQDQVFYARDLC